MDLETRLLLSNKWIETDEKLSVINPYDNKEIVKVSLAKDEHIETAIQSSLKAFEVMKTLSRYEKAKILKNVALHIEKKQNEFAELITLESGKPISAAQGEVQRAITTFLLAGEEAIRMSGETLPLDISANVHKNMGITRHFPIGPILAITPFNYPLNLVAHKVAPALAVGNPVILKPSEFTPLTAAKLGEVLIESGMPQGAVNIMVCTVSLAAKMVEDERLKMVSFTGSPKVGWHIKEHCKKKKVALELGGNAAVIIEKDCDIPLALERCVIGGYAYSGQVCISVQRIYIHEDIYDTFEEKFIEKVRAIKTGDPFKQETFVGPVIHEEALKRLDADVKAAQVNGGELLTGGSITGQIYTPTILRNVPKTCNVFKAEIFGPVTALYKYREFEQAIDEVNDSSFGLQAGIFSHNINKIFYAFEKLDVGGVMANEVPTFRVDNFPYGGVKDSGFGREGVKYTMKEMTEIKILVI